MKKLKIAIAITGASGSIYAKLLLSFIEKNKQQFNKVDLVLSSNAPTVWLHELEEEFKTPPFVTLYEKNNFLAPFASGSSGYDALIIIPCSMGVLGRIANGISDDLITRAADVMLKERKKLIIVCRETPLNLIQITNMQKVTQAGGIICPATPSFYSKPKTIEDAVQTVVDRVIDLCGIKQNTYRWGE
ncbi:MAG: UbiX family flavin prenyltransferase [Bacteroidia bacterium]|nr:UbiX family flavin prenyltransferase [Bacteroidia bacterium]